jgi:hypothetical protein
LATRELDGNGVSEAGAAKELGTPAGLCLG